MRSQSKINSLAQQYQIAFLCCFPRFRGGLIFSSSHFEYCRYMDWNDLSQHLKYHSASSFDNLLNPESWSMSFKFDLGFPSLAKFYNFPRLAKFYQKLVNLLSELKTIYLKQGWTIIRPLKSEYQMNRPTFFIGYIGLVTHCIVRLYKWCELDCSCLRRILAC